jgi:ferredoxin
MELKPIPILFGNKEDCCGCSACFAICPQNAICMRPDEEGFLYPMIDREKCIGCRMCLRVCAIKSAQEEKF